MRSLGGRELIYFCLESAQQKTSNETREFHGNKKSRDFFVKDKTILASTCEYQMKTTS